MTYTLTLPDQSEREVKDLLDVFPEFQLRDSRLP